MTHVLARTILRKSGASTRAIQSSLLGWYNFTRRWKQIEKLEDTPKPRQFSTKSHNLELNFVVKQPSPLLNHVGLFSQERLSTWISGEPNLSYQPVRHFYAKNSKVKYLDFRHRFKTTHLRLHLLIIRRQKMRKHKLRKFRRKYKALIAKTRLKREIMKEKMFRVELLTMIRDAENFDPREHALRKIEEENSKPKPITQEERFEELREKIRIHRYQVDYIKPRHKRSDQL